MTNNNIADISVFENLQNQANQSMGLQSSMSVFNADPKTIAVIKKEGEEITKKVSALGDELVKHVKTKKIGSRDITRTLEQYQNKFWDLRKQYAELGKKHDAKNDKDLESIYSKYYFGLERIYYPKATDATEESFKNDREQSKK